MLDEKKVLKLFLLERIERELDNVYLSFLNEGLEIAIKAKADDSFNLEKKKLEANEKITHLWLKDYFAMIYQRLRLPLDKYDEVYKDFFD